MVVCFLDDHFLETLAQMNYLFDGIFQLRAGNVECSAREKGRSGCIDRALQFLAAVSLLQDFEKVAVIICPQGTVCR